MTMSKEMERLKSKIEFCKKLINELDRYNFLLGFDLFKYKMEFYQNELSELYKRIQELEEGDN